MARPSSSKKVSRVASTGGGRSTRNAKPLVWWGVMALVVLLGIAGVVASREARIDKGPTARTPPVANKDHWHAAYGVYLCSEFAPSIENQNDPAGIHTHADGIIHIHPFSSASGGNNATLSQFTKASGLTLTDSKVKMPGGKTFEEGKTKCGGKDGIVQVKVNGKLITENVGDIKLTERAIITIAFAPKGAELPEPPTVPNLDNLTDVAPTEQPPASGQPPISGGDDAGTTDTTAAPATEGTTSPSTSAP